MRLTLLSVFALMICCWACNSGAGSKGVSPGGFEYEFITDKSGEIGQPGQYAFFQAKMKNGEEVTLDSRDNPVTPRIVIPNPEAAQTKPSAVVEGLALMSVGDVLTIYQPVEEGQNPPPGYKAGDKIAFELELLELKTEEEYQAEQQEKQRVAQEATKEIAEAVQKTVSDYNSGALDGQIQTSDTGLKYLVETEGTGAQAAAGNQVSVNYYGVLAANGSYFDDSFKRGRTFDFRLGQGSVIKGWDEGIAYFKEGGSGYLFVPAELGYGATGSPPSIPPNSELIFKISLEKVQDLSTQ